ncbi:hypothetical protein IQ268_30425 [Oculatella sp. LEGE 06141]|uniref:hypothetical protein n=1 Tax=Oculatella sp. LEGE 06141 TaxID=1828648 RepID=UPI001882C674|nr:hypothetical protein [Oculatella sp. LEGE 06141]
MDKVELSAIWQEQLLKLGLVLDLEESLEKLEPTPEKKPASIVLLLHSAYPQAATSVSPSSLFLEKLTNQ